MGANGAGKSATLNTIAEGLVKPDSGTITLGEKNLVGPLRSQGELAGIVLACVFLA